MVSPSLQVNVSQEAKIQRELKTFCLNIERQMLLHKFTFMYCFCLKTSVQKCRVILRQVSVCIYIFLTLFKRADN